MHNSKAPSITPHPISTSSPAHLTSKEHHGTAPSDHIIHATMSTLSQWAKVTNRQDTNHQQLTEGPF